MFSRTVNELKERAVLEQHAPAAAQRPLRLTPAFASDLAKHSDFSGSSFVQSR